MTCTWCEKTALYQSGTGKAACNTHRQQLLGYMRKDIFLQDREQTEWEKGLNEGQKKDLFVKRHYRKRK